MTCSFFLTIGKVTPEVFFKACLLRAEKRIGDAHQANMVMPAQPVTPLIMIQAQFLFQFPVIQLHPPAGSGNADEAAQPDGLPSPVGQPVFGTDPPSPPVSWPTVKGQRERSCDSRNCLDFSHR